MVILLEPYDLQVLAAHSGVFIQHLNSLLSKLFGRYDDFLKQMTPLFPVLSRTSWTDYVSDYITNSKSDRIFNTRVHLYAHL